MTSPTINPQHSLNLGAGPGLSASIACFGRKAGITTNTCTADAADPHRFRKALEDPAQRSTPAVVVYNAVVMASDSILTSDTDYVFSQLRRRRAGSSQRRAGVHPGHATGRDGDVPRHWRICLGVCATGLRHDLARKGRPARGDIAAPRELMADGVHVAGMTIAGAIAPGTPIDPDRIADTYWVLHMQPAAGWSAETVFGGQS
jgi:hypothetical protein